MFNRKSLYAGVSALGLSAAMMLPASVLAVTVGDSLKDELSNSSLSDTLEVIVSFEGDGALEQSQLDALESLGLTGVHFEALPIAGVVATPDQIDALRDIDGVRSLWLNEALEYDNADGTALTGVDRMRSDQNLRTAMGLPYSGMGIGVLVNDSGVDGHHPDLSYPDKTVQNVAAQTNLRGVDSMLPISYVEDVPDTDIAGGHGTHVAGTVGGTGAASGGEQEGVAPGADIIGYGSGAGLFILDTLGGFDYALVNQFRYNIRIVQNSFGSPGDTGSDFDPDHPTSIATKALADRNVVVVFSAGNSGSGEDTITGSFKKAPWVVTVGAGNRDGELADFSSRGKRGGGGQVEIGGEQFQWTDRPNVVAPGVDVISAQAKTDPTAPLGYDPEDPAGSLFYQSLSGTSMAAPHVSGIVALMLEADPTLHWSEVIEILEDTATNMPGYEEWEVGAGYVNAYAAVAAAAGVRDDYGLTTNLNRDFNAEASVTRVGGPDFELFFSPIGPKDVETFHVDSGLSTVVASANVSDNTVAIALTDPDGNRYGSSISLPLLGPSIAVTAPAIPGEWTIEVSGIGAVSGVTLDPLGVTNGTAAPGTINASVDFIRLDDFTGLDDIAGHPAQGLIEQAVSQRLVDARDGGSYAPDEPLTRAELADYLMQGGAIRQFRPTDGSDTILDMTGFAQAAAEAVVAQGGPLRDLVGQQGATVMPHDTGVFNGDASVRRAELAFSLIQALGLEAEAEAARQALEDEVITAPFQDEAVPLEDDSQVPVELRGHVQLALDLRLMRAEFGIEQGAFDLEPTLTAHFHPEDDVSRAAYAFNAINFLDRYRQ
ncbi:S8 family serine peptidase [Gammaproteobacteria bacterium AB-CW1]|uniref:S8 family serine peptidase n=1 Tax=Natronospira elongata TaxID=3110268 RepID=A0AAP6MM62_9GAMM|nr:S8 family serine peptidase [Gammaproteobacteria bacterium AB-CW1]